jgi:hypothetical protein
MRWKVRDKSTVMVLACRVSRVGEAVVPVKATAKAVRIEVVRRMLVLRYLLSWLSSKTFEEKLPRTVVLMKRCA